MVPPIIHGNGGSFGLCSNYVGVNLTASANRAVVVQSSLSRSVFVTIWGMILTGNDLFLEECRQKLDAA